MICIVSRYFYINRIFLLNVGLWPYDQSKLVRCQIILYFGMLTSHFIFQLARYLNAECTSELVIKAVSCLGPYMVYIISYNTFWKNTDSVRYLIERLQQICNELKDENEINIMKEYGNIVKRYTIILILFVAFSISTFTLIQTLSLILDTVLHTNGSYSRQLLNIMIPESKKDVRTPFIDEEKYYHIISLYINIASSIGLTTLIITLTMIRGWFIYVCGMFKIVSYRMEQALTIKILSDNINIQNELIIYKEIICAIDIQRKAIKYLEFLVSSFEGYIISITSINVICLTLSLYGIFQSAFVGNRKEFLLHSLFLLDNLLQIFLINYTVQEVIDHNNHIYVTVYDSRWYITSMHIQRLILFILQKNSKVFTLYVGHIFAPSLECFATLLKLSMSYFTFVCSTQQ